MLTSGDLIELDLGAPAGREAGFRHPAVVVTAQRILDAAPNVVQVVPVTTAIRGFQSEVRLDAGGRGGLDHTSAAQCQHVRAISVTRIERVRGNVGVVVLSQIRETIGLLLDIST